MVGRKSKVLIDSIDYEILKLLSNSKKAYGVLDMVEAIGLTHQNAKTHLEKLIKSGLVESWYSGESPKLLITTLISPIYRDLIMDAYIDMNEEEQKESDKNFKDFKNFLKKLDKIMEADKEKEKILNLSKSLSEEQQKKLKAKITEEFVNNP